MIDQNKQQEDDPRFGDETSFTDWEHVKLGDLYPTATRGHALYTDIVSSVRYTSTRLGLRRA